MKITTERRARQETQISGPTRRALQDWPSAIAKTQEKGDGANDPFLETLRYWCCDIPSVFSASDMAALAINKKHNKNHRKQCAETTARIIWVMIAISPYRTYSLRQILPRW